MDQVSFFTLYKDHLKMYVFLKHLQVESFISNLPIFIILNDEHQNTYFLHNNLKLHLFGYDQQLQKVSLGLSSNKIIILIILPV